MQAMRAIGISSVAQYKEKFGTVPSPDIASFLSSLRALTDK